MTERAAGAARTVVRTDSLGFCVSMRERKGEGGSSGVCMICSNGVIGVLRPRSIAESKTLCWLLESSGNCGGEGSWTEESSAGILDAMRLLDIEGGSTGDFGT